jgi:hypothetical protein
VSTHRRRATARLDQRRGGRAVREGEAAIRLDGRRATRLHIERADRLGSHSVTSRVAAVGAFPSGATIEHSPMHVQQPPWPPESVLPAWCDIPAMAA